jgi:hypothetical protein
VHDASERKTLQEEFSKLTRVACDRILQVGIEDYEQRTIGRIPEGFITKENVKVSTNAKIMLGKM